MSKGLELHWHLVNELQVRLQWPDGDLFVAFKTDLSLSLPYLIFIEGIRFTHGPTYASMIGDSLGVWCSGEYLIPLSPRRAKLLLGMVRYE